MEKNESVSHSLSQMLCFVMLQIGLVAFVYSEETLIDPALAKQKNAEITERLKLVETARETIFLYGLALDNSRLDALAKIFAENIVLKVTPDVVLQGRAAVLSFYGDVLSKKVDHRKHFIANTIITQAQDDHASAMSYFMAVHQNNGLLSLAWGTYRFEVQVDENGVSRIAELVIDIEVPLSSIGPTVTEN